MTPRSLLNFSNALVENVISGCVMVINKKARRLLLNNLPTKRVLMHDWWVYLVVSAFGKVIYDEKPLIKYRQHSSNVIGGTSSIYGQMRKRIKRFVKNSDVYRCTDQAKEFQERYHGLLDDDTNEILIRLIESKENILNRLKYSINKEVRRQMVVDDLILRVLILLGRY